MKLPSIIIFFILGLFKISAQNDTLAFTNANVITMKMKLS